RADRPGREQRDPVPQGQPEVQAGDRQGARRPQGRRQLRAHLDQVVRARRQPAAGGALSTRAMDLPSLAALAWPGRLKGTGYTLLFAVWSMLLALPLSSLVTLVRVLRVPVLRTLMTLYVSAIRGTPLLVQVFIVYYGLPAVGIELSPITAGILAL